MMAFCITNECASYVEAQETRQEVEQWEDRLSAKLDHEDYLGFRHLLGDLVQHGKLYPDDREMVKTVFENLRERFPLIIKNELEIMGRYENAQRANGRRLAATRGR